MLGASAGAAHLVARVAGTAEAAVAVAALGVDAAVGQGVRGEPAVCRYVISAVCRYIISAVCRYIISAVCRYVISAVCRYAISEEHNHQCSYLGSVHSLMSTQSLLTPSPTHSCPLQSQLPRMQS